MRSEVSRVKANNRIYVFLKKKVENSIRWAVHLETKNRWSVFTVSYKHHTNFVFITLVLILYPISKIVAMDLDWTCLLKYTLYDLHVCYIQYDLNIWAVGTWVNQHLLSLSLLFSLYILYVSFTYFPSLGISYRSSSVLFSFVKCNGSFKFWTWNIRA